MRQEVLPLIAENDETAYWLDAAYEVLSDSIKAPDDQLPHTGMATEVEEALSSVYIESAALAGYGTRSQSVLTLRSRAADNNQAKVASINRQVIAQLISRDLMPDQQ